MDYITVYEVTEEHYYIIWLPLSISVIGLGVFFFSKKKAFGAFVAIFGGIFSLITIPDQLANYSESSKLYNLGEYEIAEGEIEEFTPMPVSGRGNENFTVQSIFFEYADSDETYCGFNNAKSHGGPITGNGQKVRIGYIPKENKNVILKLEIEKP